MDFDFSKEMVYGRKHLSKLSFSKEKYDITEMMTSLFNSQLKDVDDFSHQKYELFTELGKDSHTHYHRSFYGKIDKDDKWRKEFEEKYYSFVSDVVLPYLGLEEALVQKYPSYRVQLPNNVAIVKEHYDSDDDHKHPYGEINFIYALTDMYDTNTVMIEKMPRCGEYLPLTLKRGECISFNGNLCSHYNQINKTGKTRMSFDFRIMPLNLYNPDYQKLSVTKKIEYKEGGYYIRIKSSKGLEISGDVWNKEKDKFNMILNKYKLNDAWEIVDLFEKKIAQYAGSKYAVSVDNCTNALFLCIKYLGYVGEITIPSKTYCSVPCTIRNAGCKVKFEDIKWSGAYRLKPLPIFDGAVRFKKDMYQSGSFHCLSFHIRKHIPIGKGGMILCDDKKAYDWFKLMRYEGRHIADGVAYKDDKFETLGWNMYMTPEQAHRGLQLFENIAEDNPDQGSSETCKDLSKYSVYTK